MKGKVKYQKKTILVVEDDTADLNLLSFLLEKQGYKVKCVKNGLSVMAEIESATIDLVLLDIKLPDIDGYEVCRLLKSFNKSRDIPVIFISALENVWDKVKAFKAGGVDYITKPFESKEILVRIENQLTIMGLQAKLVNQNLHLRKEISARIKVEDELHQLNADLEKRVEERTRQLNIEREHSEKLLLNILPSPIIEQLKHSQQSIAEDIKDVSILFADIVSFTEISHKHSSREMVTLLNKVFTSFDQLAEKHGLEKIKTIGDAYLVVGGLPGSRGDHAHAIAEMALAMIGETNELSEELQISIKIRVGINSGPVTAGVIGKFFFVYDLWGDSVNIASRMESYGRAGEIHVSETTYERLKGVYEFEERGIIEVKGKGKMKTHFLKKRK